MDSFAGRPRRILRSQSLRRRSKPVPLSERVHLERVLGLTASSNASLACDPNTGLLAYTAGCVVVLYNPKRNRQSHIYNQSRKTITCLAFSPDGKHLVTGESGHQPAVRVWDLEEKAQVVELHGHKFGINCVAFHPNLKYIVSIGTQHDMSVNVWNWRYKVTVASNKIATKVTGITFSDDGSTFVTVGNRHVKFWYLDASKSRVKETVPLLGRSGILGEQKNNFFCSVAFGHGDYSSSTYVITQSGLLCEFNEKRLLDKWVELRTTSANSVAAGEKYIFIGCADGVVRVFDTSLHFVATLPRPHYLGVDVSSGSSPSHMAAQHSNAKYPDTVAVCLDSDTKKLTCIYNDHSMYIWDVNDIKKVGKSRSFLYHSGCIWGLDVYPVIEESLPAALPPGSFITCSNDDTIRMWNLDPNMPTDLAVRKNIYSSELLKIIYTDTELNNILDIEFNKAGKTDKTDTQCLEKNGVRSVKVSPDGQHLASGDRMGNIRVHELQFMDEVCMLEAHDSEVLCLEFTKPETGVRLMASASRDRLIHLFDPDKDYELVQTLDDHSSAITAVCFNEQDDQLHMISCGADKSVLFRTAQQDSDSGLQFVLNRHLVGKTTLYDMDVDATKKFVATACQDRNVRIYNIKNGKQKKCYKGSVGDDGTLIKVQLDPSGAYIAASCSDKNIAIYDFFTGECVATMFGHSELVTGIKFMNDLRHLLTVSGDGCVFVWRLPLDVTEHMQSRLVELGKLSSDQVTPNNNELLRRQTYVAHTAPKIMDQTMTLKSEDSSDYQPATPKILASLKKGLDNNANPNGDVLPNREGYRFSVGQLPAWAKKQVMQEPVGKAGSLPNAAAPRGRWAQRVDNQGIVMKSMMDENSSIQLSLADSMDRRRFTVEPDTLAEQVKGLRRETIVINREKGQNVPVITDDDENNRDDEDEDDEFFSNKDQLEKLFNNDINELEPGSITTRRGSDLTNDHQDSLLEEFDIEDDADIMYLPNDDGSESSETIASSFRVFDTTSLCSFKDGSEGTDPSDEESEPPTPTTPIDPMADFSAAVDSNKEELFRNNYENLGASPALQSFHETLEAVEKQFNTEDNDPSRFFNPRLSISSRFLSRAQQQHLRSVAAMQNRSRSQSPAVAGLQNWKNSDVSPPEKDNEHSDLSPPTRLSNKNLLNDSGSSSKGRSSLGGESKRKGEGRALWERRSLDPSLARKWKSLHDINEDQPLSPMTPNSPKTRPRSKTPTSRMFNSPNRSQSPGPNRYGRGKRRASGRVASRSAKVTRTEMKLDPARRRSRSTRAEEEGMSGRSKSEHNLSNAGKTESSGGTTARRRAPSYMMATESTMSKTKRASSTTTLNKDGDKSSSPKKIGASRRGRLSSGMKSKFKSTPDLASMKDDDDGDDGVLAPTSKTTEDLNLGASKNLMTSKNNMISRRSMPATKEKKDHFSIFDPTPPSTDSSAEFDKLHSSSQPPPLPSSLPPSNMSKEELDRLVMPPPPPISTLSRAKQDAFLKRAAQSNKKTTSQDLTLAEAKAILTGKSKADSTDSDSTTSSLADRSDSTNSDTGYSLRTRKILPKPPIDGDTAPPVPLSQPPGRTQRHLEPSPNDLPVKDNPGPERPGTPTKTKRSPGRAVSPFVGSLRDAFEPDRARSESPRQGRRLPTEPAAGSPRTIKDTRSSSAGDIKSISKSSPESSENESRSSEEKMFETSVHDRVAQFEMNSPQSPRRQGVVSMSNNSRWRHRLMQVGEGDEGGIQGELSPGSPKISPQNSPLSQSNHWDRHMTSSGLSLPRSSTDPGISQSGKLGSPTRSQPLTISPPTSPGEASPVSPTRSITVTIQGRQRTLVSYVSQGRRHSEPPKQVTWKDANRESRWRSRESPARVQTIPEHKAQESVGEPDSPTASPSRDIPASILRSKGRTTLGSAGGEPDSSGDDQSVFRQDSKVRENEGKASTLPRQRSRDRDSELKASTLPRQQSRERESEGEALTLPRQRSRDRDSERKVLTLPRQRSRERESEGEGLTLPRQRSRERESEGEGLTMPRQRSRERESEGEGLTLPRQRSRERESEGEASPGLRQGSLEREGEGEASSTSRHNPGNRETEREAPALVRQRPKASGEESKPGGSLSPVREVHTPVIPSPAIPSPAIPSPAKEDQATTGRASQSQTQAPSITSKMLPPTPKLSEKEPVSSSATFRDSPSRPPPRTNGESMPVPPPRNRSSAGASQQQQQQQQPDSSPDSPVKRPDKTRRSPPTSLTTNLPSDIKDSAVMLTPPRPAKTVVSPSRPDKPELPPPRSEKPEVPPPRSADKIEVSLSRPSKNAVSPSRPDRTQLSLPLRSRSSPKQETLPDDVACQDIAEEIKMAIDNAVDLVMKLKASQGRQSSEGAKALEEALSYSQTSLAKVCAAPPARLPSPQTPPPRLDEETRNLLHVYSKEMISVLREQLKTTDK